MLQDDYVEPRYGFYCLTGILVAGLWTSVGLGVALWKRNSHEFLRHWILLQGFFLTALGVWLLQIIRSHALEDRIAAVRQANSPSVRLGTANTWIRFSIVTAVSIGGTASLIALGFNDKGAILVFMWLTCAAICTAAGFVTMHAIDIVFSIHRLQRIPIRLLRYSPAKTVPLRALVAYFTSFTLIMTFGYGFAFGATLYPYWTGSKQYVTAVRVFWPLVYVPTCSIALFYPHFVIHKLIRREKERILGLYHNQIDTLLGQYDKLTTQDIDRTNTLAQLFDRISATPEYVLDFGIAVRTILPIALNVATLVIKAVTK
jgi:hypothetical protein